MDALASPLVRSEKFSEAQYMRDLVHLKETQEAIQSLSAWCLRNRKYAYKIAKGWLKVIKKVKPEQKLVLFYLLNDIVQHSKRKNVPDLLEKCELVLKEAMPCLKEDTMGQRSSDKIKRVLNIWEEREVFETKTLDELRILMDPNASDGAQQEIVDNFQPQQLCTQLKIIKALEDDTDYKHKQLKTNEVDLIDIEALRQSLKDREHGNDFIADFEEGRKKMEQYIKALDKEITKRRQVIELLSHGGKYYDSLMEEANIVGSAYTNFGKRVSNLKTKLQDKLVTLESKHRDLVSISPIPSPDYDAPSPDANDEMELELPEEGGQTGNIITVNEPVVVAKSHDYHHSQEQQQQQQQEPQQHGVSNHSSSGDLNSRLNSMMDSLPGTSNSNGSPGFHSDSSRSTLNKNYSISEYLAKLATGEVVEPDQEKKKAQWWAQSPPPPPPPKQQQQQHHHVQPQQEPWQHHQEDWPPPHNAWPEPQPEAREEVEEPIPEWKIQLEDVEPPEEVEEVFQENMALARLNSKQKDHNLIDLTKDDNPEVIPTRHQQQPHQQQPHHQQPHQQQQLPPPPQEKRHSSLQERLKNLAGVPALEGGVKLGHKFEGGAPPSAMTSSPASMLGPPPSLLPPGPPMLGPRDPASGFRMRFNHSSREGRPPVPSWAAAGPPMGSVAGGGPIRNNFRGGFRGGRPPRRGPRW